MAKGEVINMAVSDKDEIREKVNIVDIIGEYINLEDRGSKFWALCPFHTEDTASFAVTPEMGVYKCFGCGASGDVFDFVMEMEGVEFVESLEIVADKAGLEFEHSSGSDSDSDHTPRKTLYEANEFALEIFRNQFPGSESEKYLVRDRGFHPGVIETYEVGHANSTWEFVADRVVDRFSEEVAVDAGLASERDNGTLYDRFVNRVVFPVRDRRDRVVGFSARSLPHEDGHKAKYLNTPDTPIFDKSKHLYGWNAGGSNTLWIVEGQLDVIRLRQHGLDALAPLGSALSERQQRIIERVVEEKQDVVLAFDGDDAGAKFTYDVASDLYDRGIITRVADIDDDPSSDYREDGPYPSNVSTTHSFRWAINTIASVYDVTTTDGRSKIVEKMTPMLESINDPAVLNDAVEEISEVSGINRDLIIDALDGESDDVGRADYDKREKTTTSGYSVELERLCMIALSMDAREVGDNPPVLTLSTARHVHNPESRKLYESIVELVESDTTFTIENLRDICGDEITEVIDDVVFNEQLVELSRSFDEEKIIDRIRSSSVTDEIKSIREELGEDEDIDRTLLRELGRVMREGL